MPAVLVRMAFLPFLQSLSVNKTIKNTQTQQMATNVRQAANNSGYNNNNNFAVCGSVVEQLKNETILHIGKETLISHTLTQTHTHTQVETDNSRECFISVTICCYNCWIYIYHLHVRGVPPSTWYVNELLNENIAVQHQK